MAKSASKSASKPKRAKKPAPQPNAEAVARYAAERAGAESRKPQAQHSKSELRLVRSAALEAGFLRVLRQGYSVIAAAEAIGVADRTVFRWRVDSEASFDKESGLYADDFCVRWDEAIQAGIAKLEDEAMRRAMRGVEKPVYQQGVMVGTVTEYSDSLMQTLLRGKMPQRYNTERHEHTGKDGGPMVHNIQVEFLDGPEDA